MRRCARWTLGAAILVSLASPPAWAASPGPPEVSSLFVPLEGEVMLSNGDLVSFAGEVHVLTQVVFSGTGVPSTSIYVNLARVQGTGTSGAHYVVVGAVSTTEVGANPGPPEIPGQEFNFALVTLGVPPSPAVPPSPILSVVLEQFTFCQESDCAPGALFHVEAHF